MKRFLAVSISGLMLVGGAFIGTSANAAPKVKSPTPTITSTEVPEPTVTRTPKPEYTIPPCIVDGEPEAC